jgi:LysR family transcriptional activator of nhaA
LADLPGREPLVLPTPDTALCAGFDAQTAWLGMVPRIAAEADDVAMSRLSAREDAGLAVMPPIVVQDELAMGRLVEAARLPGLDEHFLAVTLSRRFPSPLLAEVLPGTGQEFKAR